MAGSAYDSWMFLLADDGWHYLRMMQPIGSNDPFERHARHCEAAHEAKRRRLAETPHDWLISLVKRVAPDNIFVSAGFMTADYESSCKQAQSVALKARSIYVGVSANPAFRFLGEVPGEPKLIAYSFNAENIPPHNDRFEFMTIVAT